MDSMTIEEAKNLRTRLEGAIELVVKKYNEQSGATVESIFIKYNFCSLSQEYEPTINVEVKI